MRWWIVVVAVVISGCSTQHLQRQLNECSHDGIVLAAALTACGAQLKECVAEGPDADDCKDFGIFIYKAAK